MPESLADQRTSTVHPCFANASERNLETYSEGSSWMTVFTLDSANASISFVYLVFLCKACGFEVVQSGQVLGRDKISRPPLVAVAQAP